MPVTLNPQIKAFCDHYLKYGSKLTAYQLSHPGCSDSTANAASTRMLKRADVQAYLRPWEQIRTNYIENLILEVARDQTLIARASLCDIVRWDESGIYLREDLNFENLTNQEKTSLSLIKFGHRNGKLVSARIDSAAKDKAINWLFDFHGLRGKGLRWQKLPYWESVKDEGGDNSVKLWKIAGGSGQLDLDPKSCRVVVLEISKFKQRKGIDPHPQLYGLAA